MLEHQQVFLGWVCCAHPCANRAPDGVGLEAQLPELQIAGEILDAPATT